MPKRVACGGTFCTSFLTSGQQEAPFTSEGGKMGIPGAISGERPRSSPSCLTCLGGFGAFRKRGRTGCAVLVLRCCGARPPSQQGEGEGPLLPVGLPPVPPRPLTLAEFRLWIFAEVFFGLCTVLGKDSSMLALEKTPVCFK